MVGRYRKETRKQKQIKLWNEELEQNKETFKKNEVSLEQKAELLEAMKKDFEIGKKSYELNKEILTQELEKPKVIHPLMEFHTDPKWQKAFENIKAFELEGVEHGWELQQKDLEFKRERTDKMFDQNKIQEQQNRIEIRNAELKESLKNAGAEVKEEKQDYIG